MKTLKELREKSVSQAQQKMMGMALAYKRGEMDDASPEVKKMADSMSTKDLEDFAKTKHKGLPVQKESVELEEAFTPKEIKMAIGVASDKRYAKGNMTGAVNAIEKIKKGLSDHPQVRAVLRRQNESVEMDEAAPKLKGNNGPYTRQQIEAAAKKAKVDMGAKARMMMALREM